MFEVRQTSPEPLKTLQDLPRTPHDRLNANPILLYTLQTEETCLKGGQGQAQAINFLFEVVVTLSAAHRNPVRAGTPHCLNFRL